MLLLEARICGISAASWASLCRLLTFYGRRIRSAALVSMLVFFNGSPGLLADSGLASAFIAEGEAEVSREDLLLSEEEEARARALAHYYVGMRQEQAADFIGATESYRLALKEDPANVELAEKSAHILAQYGRIDEAFGLLKENEEVNPGSPGIQIALSRFLAVYEPEGKSSSDAALKMAESAVAEFPEEITVLEHYVDLLRAKGKRGEAGVVVQDAIFAKKKRSAEYWIALAKVSKRVWPIRNPEGREENLAKVNDLYERALVADPESSEIRSKVADFFVNSQQWERARVLHEELIESRPDLLDERYRLSKIYGVLGEVQLQVETLEALVQVDPTDSEAQLELAVMYDEAAQIEAADGDYDEADAGFRKAAERYEVAFALNVGSFSEHLRLGNILLFYLQDYEAALNFSRRADRQFEENPNAKFLLSLALARKELFAEAAEVFAETERIATRIAPDRLDYFFYFEYAISHERIENYSEAAELFRKSIELSPSDDPSVSAQAMNYLGYMLLEQDMELEEAGKWIEKANVLVPDSSAYLDSLGWYYFKVGRYEEALTALLDARANMTPEQLERPENAVILDHLAQAYGKTGQPQKALKYARQAEELDGELEGVRERVEALEAELGEG